MVLAGVVAMLPLWLILPALLIAVPALVVLVLSALLPRGHLATVFVGVVVLWAVICGPNPPWLYGIVALGCLGVHWAGVASSVGPSFAVVDRSVWRGLAVPAWIAVGGIVVTAVIASLLGLVTLPGSLVLVVLTIAIVLVAAVAVLWPTRARGR
jgi:hypothetical protein